MKKNITVQQWNDHWLSLAKDRLRKTSYSQYRSVITEVINPAIGHLTLSELSDMVAQKFVNDQIQDKRGLNRLDLAITVQKMSLDVAFDERLIPYNSFKLVKVPRKMAKEMSILYTEDIKKILTEHADEPFTPLYVIIMMLGLRVAEAMGLTWKHVDLITKEVLICQNAIRYRDDDGHYVNELELNTKNGVKETLIIDQITEEWLLRQKDIQDQWSHKDYLRYSNPDGYVFTKPDGSRLDYAYIEPRFKKLMKAIEREEVTLHKLRHTAASITLNSTHNRMYTLEFLRDRSIEALDNYVHPTLEQELAFAKTLHDKFAPFIIAALGEEYCHV